MSRFDKAVTEALRSRHWEGRSSETDKGWFRSLFGSGTGFWCPAEGCYPHSGFYFADFPPSEGFARSAFPDGVFVRVDGDVVSVLRDGDYLELGVDAFVNAVFLEDEDRRNMAGESLTEALRSRHWASRNEADWTKSLAGHVPFWWPVAGSVPPSGFYFADFSHPTECYARWLFPDGLFVRVDGDVVYVLRGGDYREAVDLKVFHHAVFLADEDRRAAAGEGQ